MRGIASPVRARWHMLACGFRVVRAANGRLTIKGKTETWQLEYDKLLLGIGRKANVEDLGLEVVSSPTTPTPIPRWLPSA